jgi:exodeoxyribonuclease VII small subunit
MAKARTYKQIREELDHAVSLLQNDDTDVDDVIKLYKEAQELIKEIEDYIKKAENSVKEIKTNFKKT